MILYNESVEKVLKPQRSQSKSTESTEFFLCVLCGKVFYMKLGVMNHPAENIFSEIKWAAENGFDFLDLTLEPPLAYLDPVRNGVPYQGRTGSSDPVVPVERSKDRSLLNPKEIKDELAKFKLGVVGHTAYYLPIGSPIEAIRDASVNEIIRCMEFDKQVGVQKVNIHPDFNQPHFFSQKEKIGFNIYSLSKIVDAAKKIGVSIMVENSNSCTHELNEFFIAIPELKFHFDLGHANLKPGERDFEKMLIKFSERLVHVHFSDNKGGYNDLHIPLGTGTVEWKEAISVLKKIGYDGTITLEIFSHDRDYLLLTKEKVKKYWLEAL
ncbi:MAG: sugar phosphate isomerase/epimerase family protein [Elusimicrobiota bacterium]